ncbi:2-succinyl-5-enolpyruvyl-6-hydroxy-3-cyclohexene-1-carboxylate synthase OS=Ureibacillus acetophenoni OX=614649 GN=menD PE=3 SV=1 [Ureibacillus acetophenoni]
MNIPFREPLLINFQESLPPVSFKGSFIGEITPSEESRYVLTQLMNQAKKGFVIVGELPLNTDLHYMWEFVRKVKWPVLVESLSNMRTNIPVGL